MISVIIPFYNAAPFLASCLNSLVSQTETNWEAILVDDGSTDGSSDLCSAFARKDDRIRCFRQANSGVSTARNTGITQARGEWICFVDADDILPTNALQTLLCYALEKECDLLIGGYEVYDSSYLKTYSIDACIHEDLNKEAALSLMYKPKYYRYLGYVWGKLFKKDLIQRHHLLFNPKIHFNEDRLFVTQYISRCESIFLFTEPVYHYIERPTSAMASISKRFNEDFLTDLDGYIGMKETLLNTHCSNQAIKMADEGIASSYWRIRRMMKLFHVSSGRLLFYLHKKVFQNVSMRAYLLLIVKPFFGNILRHIGIR